MPISFLSAFLLIGIFFIFIYLIVSLFAAINFDIALLIFISAAYQLMSMRLTIAFL